VGGHRVIVKAPPTATYKVGEKVRVAIDMDRVHLFDAGSEAAIARR
jgi:multiple sugar transport system ATP-binding protein